ncbi:MAG: S9 family peptidase [Gammaproteobacteria bacterium]|nr:prolyl oligopeptidase family serine peptidase [Gammaproteobacteria bacterium]MBU6509505.1 prolyl oligopeptidase family serine peptidase [Gammaproteobacteria bacterium]MDE1984262.1 S9 family peptidase [Gammaproteobacteria bacterium]MDE2108363.1 S9 family peptidase [Gammaproteobacteria bacterium]MDE2461095.1 S9 family peptidase [Gammaproteobacteria bacterium]
MPRSLRVLFWLPLVVTLLVLSGIAAQAQTAAAKPFTMEQVLGYPYPSDLVSSPNGDVIAWVLDQRGVRNIWVAFGPDFQPKLVTHYENDDGQELSNLSISADGKYLVYVRGGDHDANWPEYPQPDPASSPVEPKLQIWCVSLTTGEPRVLSEGDAPAISPDGKRVAFIHLPGNSVWWVPIDGSQKAQLLFFDHGQDSDLQWSPDGKALAFVSGRGDHSFIGVYRNDSIPIEYLAPSTANDLEPRWSPEGTRIVFARTPGNGGPPQSILEWHPLPWSIWVANVANGQGRAIWNSPDTLRASFPQEGGDLDLHWVAGNQIAFLSEMDNWPHLYVVSADGGPARLLTPGKFMIEEVTSEPGGKFLVYSANAGSTPGDDDRRHLFRVSVSGGAPQAVTSGDHSQWSPVLGNQGKSLAFVDAGARQPPLVTAGALGSDHWRALDRDQIPEDFPTEQLVTPKLVDFRSADGWHVQGQLFNGAEGSAKKPAIIFVHGGPPRQMLLTWHNMDYYSNSYAVNQYLANHGFIVLSVNYRLSIGYGHDFHYPAHWGPTGASEYKDVLAAAKYLQHDPQVDAKRIGIWGGSYGGYLTALALARNSNIFKAGVDFHGVHDWSMFVDDWFGKPVQRYQMPDTKALMKVFWESSPDSAIAKWKSPVLLIQGDDDRNVHFHQMVDLVRRLQFAHVPYQEIVIPNEIHGFLRYQSWLESDQATVNFFARQFRTDGE